MKRNTINFSIFLMLSFAFMSISTMAQANNATTVEKIPLSGTLYACNGEGVDFAGTGNLVTHSSVSNSGRVNFQIHGNVSVKAVGQITGAPYVSFETFNYGERFDSTDSAPYVFTWVGNFNLNGQGSVPNLKGHRTFHTTINANGELSSFRMTLTIDCNP